MGAAIPIGLAVIGGGISAYGKYKEGQDAADAAMQNRQFALMAARDATIRGQEKAGMYRAEGSRVIGAQRVAAGASGTAVDSDSSVALQESTRALSEMDALQARNNAAREAWGYTVQADQFRDQAKRLRSSSRWAAAGSLLGTAGSVGSAGYGAYQDWTKSKGAK